jgi:hypothetical protein
MNHSSLPVAVIGAGPVGLAAAAHLARRGRTPVVFETGSAVGSSVRQWGHVKVFSPWRYNIDRVAADLLAETGWVAPDPNVFPTGSDLVNQYLEPLAALPAMRQAIRLSTRVLAVTRAGFDKMKSAGREEAPFLIRYAGPDGDEGSLLAAAVIDASGTYEHPNPLGAGGIPALGERALSNRISYGIPDVLGRERARYAGKRVLVVGGGHSAFNTLLDLAKLQRQEPGTVILWAVRRSAAALSFGGGERDALPQRGAIGKRVRQLLNRGAVEMFAGFQTIALERVGDSILVHGEGSILPPVDEIIATTGFRPDLDILRELRLDLDPAVESPSTLAPLIDPNVHSCGSVPPHGFAELRHPETDFYIVGMKSYGRAPTFLLLTGYEQVRSIAAGLVGDYEAARSVELVLPETGVCTLDGVEAAAPVAVGAGVRANGSVGGCCGV